MKRAVIFAHYDKDGIIKDYILYYLKELKMVADKIVFVSCSDLKNSESLNGLADYDELIFANDSCYGPLYPLKNVFSEMENRNCDFWGITKNNFGYKKSIGHFFIKRPHIQSYFVVVKKCIFEKDFFVEFMKSITHQENKKLIISNYEIGLTELLLGKGYKYSTLINAYENINNIAILKWREIIEKHKMPFIKKSLFDLKNTDATTIENYENILGNYPKTLIIVPREINRKIPFILKKIIFTILANFPFVIRKPFAIMINKLFPFIKD